jgi:hypothetical protein
MALSLEASAAPGDLRACARLRTMERPEGHSGEETGRGGGARMAVRHALVGRRRSLAMLACSLQNPVFGYYCSQDDVVLSPIEASIFCQAQITCLWVSQHN